MLIKILLGIVDILGEILITLSYSNSYRRLPDSVGDRLDLVKDQISKLSERK
jgi:hypothetical protein